MRLDRKKITRRSLIAGGVAGIGCVGGWIEHEALKLERVHAYPIGYTGPPKRIAFLSDLHIASTRERDRALRAVEMAAKEKPDLLLLGGDYSSRFGGFREHDIHDFLHACARVAPAAGIFGNHDYDTDWPDRLRWHFKDAGIPLLVNREVEVAGLRVYGTDDVIMGDPKAPPEGDPPDVMLLHEPDFLDFAPVERTLILSGHTHGGQICLPFGIPLILPPGGRTGPSSGLRWVNRRYIYVSRGVGTTSFPLRLFCRPEVTIIDYLPKPN